MAMNMKKVPWGKLTVLKVIGASVSKVLEVIPSDTDRIFEADHDVLIQLHDTHPDADAVVGLLEAEFGKDKVNVICAV